MVGNCSVCIVLEVDVACTVIWLCASWRALWTASIPKQRCAGGLEEWIWNLSLLRDTRSPTMLRAWQMRSPISYSTLVVVAMLVDKERR